MIDKKINRIGIDARFYGPVGKGLGRYTQEIFDNIVKIDQENEYIIFLRQENFGSFQCDGERVKKILVNIGWYGWAEQIIFPLYIWREHLDLMHFPHFNVPIFCPVKFIVTIHDLILIKFPTQRTTTLGLWPYKIKNLAYRLVIWLAVKRARKVIAVSNFTKNDIIEKFKIPSDKIEVTYEGVANLRPPLAPPLGRPHPRPSPSLERGVGRGDERERFFSGEGKGDKEVLLKYNINSPYLLYVGNAYPHKNLEGLLEVFLRGVRRDNNLQLVLVGKDDYFYKRIRDYAQSLNLWQSGTWSPVLFPGYVPDSELAIFYRNALTYVFPSFYEGFGLPPLEAMARGCPVVSSNKASLPEILGDAVLYFDPNDKEMMQRQIELIIKDENLRQDLVGRGYEQVKKYSWRECARKTLGIYKEVLK